MEMRKGWSGEAAKAGAAIRYAVVPCVTLEKLLPWMDGSGISYEIIRQPDFPEDVPEECSFNGRRHERTVCIASEMDPRKLVLWNKKIHGMRPDPGDYKIIAERGAGSLPGDPWEGILP